MASKDRARHVKRITDSILTLPALPTVTAKLLEMVDNPRTSAGTLSHLIMQDQVLTARILKLANSSFYGFPRSIGTVKLAVVVLGFDAVKEMGLGLSVIGALKREGEGDGLDVARFWQHSVAVAAATRLLSRTACYRLSGEAFVAGLLHDIGKLVMSLYLPEDLALAQELARGGRPQAEAEMHVMGATHAQVGAWLAERWNLPEGLVAAIRYHDEPHACPEAPELALLVCLANQLTHMCRIGDSGCPGPGPLPAPAAAMTRRLLNLDPGALEQFRAELFLEYDKAQEFLMEA